MEPLVSWSPEETRALIAVWSEEKVRHELEAPLRNESVYADMSNRLAAVGISRSAKQCRAKIKLLKQEYGDFKLACNSGEVNGKTFRWYDAVDSIMSDRPTDATTNTERSDTVILELMISDVETGPHTTTTVPKTFTSSFPTLCPSENSQGPDSYSAKPQECELPSTSATGTSSAGQTAVMMGRKKGQHRV